MAQVTNLTLGHRRIIGDLVLHVFIFSGPSGSTLPVPVPSGKIVYANNQTSTNPALLTPASASLPAQTLIQSWVVSAGTIPSQSVFTITSSGTMTGEVFLVIARVG